MARLQDFFSVEETLANDVRVVDLFVVPISTGGGSPDDDEKLLAPS